MDFGMDDYFAPSSPSKYSPAILDDDLSPKNTEELLKSVSAVYGKKIQRIHAPNRKELPPRLFEYGVDENGQRCLKIPQSLAESLAKVSKYIEIAQKLRRAKSSKALPAPLERPEAEKIKRSVAYDNTKKSLSKWEPVVTTNKVTPELHFPLNTPYFKMSSTKDFISKYKPKSKLEKEVDSILQGVSKKEEEKETPQPRKTFFLNRKEIMEQRKEMARVRAQQSYREAKARRQNKIKSKKYHRILRREKTKKQIEEFEKLQKTDPEAALKKLDELEKTRAEERVSLRHRSTGQWARNKAVHAKYDLEARQQLHQQLSMSKDLTVKVKTEPVSEDEDNQNVEDNPQLSDDNPWLQKRNEYEEFSNKYRKYWGTQAAKQSKESERDNQRIQEEVKKREEDLKRKWMMSHPLRVEMRSGFIVTDMVGEEFQNKDSFSSGWKCTPMESPPKPKKPKKNNMCKTDVDDFFERLEKMIDQKFDKKVAELQGQQNARKSKKKSKKLNRNKNVAINVEVSHTHVREDLSEKAINDETNKGEKSNWSVTDYSGLALKQNGGIGQVTASTSKANIDSSEINPANFIQINEKKLNSTQVPDLIADEEDSTADSERERLITISEAFTDDDVVAEFRQEKEAIAEKDKPKDVNLTLPGWGEWAGKGLTESKRKGKRFVIKAPKQIPRKDDKKETVIINENSDSKAREHQVSELPHPYVAVETFESSIRAPLGSTWVPETAHRKFIAPKIKTLMGTVIEPLSDDALMDDMDDYDEDIHNFDENAYDVD